MKNYPDYYTSLRKQVKQLGEASPDVMQSFGSLHQNASAAGALSTKTKELIALGIAITVRCDGCIAYHVVDALKAGATPQEITETINVSILMGGGPSVMYGAQAHAALKQFMEHPKDWSTAA